MLGVLFDFVFIFECCGKYEEVEDWFFEVCLKFEMLVELDYLFWI